MNVSLFSTVNDYCNDLKSEFDLIKPDRKVKLQQLSRYISNRLSKNECVDIIVICTHNSRRSHFGQLWLAIAADYYDIKDIHTFSGGTEATAFHPNAIQALRNIGLKISSDSQTDDNPKYYIQWKSHSDVSSSFSKKYNHLGNPSDNFAAIMVCTDADEHCPIVNGADYRLSLPFQDPKAYDKTIHESEEYNKTCKQIGREMFYILSLVKK